MQVTERVEELRAALSPLRQRGHTIGFVPTMGYLHDGHLALVRRARQANNVVVASVFVNPLQFGPHEDFERYPRDLERDAQLLQQAGVDLLFAPAVNEMYPQPLLSHVVVEGITERLEGAARPGHFRGVATVVAKLFNIVQPHRAYFGQKDFQQLQVIRRMVRDLNFPVEIEAVPTVREADGLAMSSRNTYLSPPERAAATVLIRALRRGEEQIRNGERDAARVRSAMEALIAQEPLARLDYLSLADPETLSEQDVVRAPVLLSLAVYIGKTRLIDNVLLENLEGDSERGVPR